MQHVEWRTLYQRILHNLNFNESLQSAIISSRSDDNSAMFVVSLQKCSHVKNEDKHENEFS